MSSFTNAFPTFRADGRRNGYRLTESFEYYTEIDGKRVTIYVHDEFYTDLMSGPEWLKNSIGLEREDYAAASIVHDHLYRYRIAKTMTGTPIKLTRKQCDLIMKEAMLLILNIDTPIPMSANDMLSHAREVDKIRKVYKILRWGGWLAFLKWRLKGFFS